MTVALSTRALASDAEAGAAPARLRRLELRTLHAELAPGGEPAVRGLGALREEGISFSSVALSPDDALSSATFAGAAERAEAVARALRAPAVVVEGGAVPAGAGERLGRAARERAVERAVRALHPLVRRGVPVGLRNGAGGDALVGFEETGWILGELPALSLWFDPLRAAAGGADVARWADRHAGRMGGVLVAGLGAAEEGPLAAGTLRGMLPRRVPWVLEVGPDAGDERLRLALLFLRSLTDGSPA